MDTTYESATFSLPQKSPTKTPTTTLGIVTQILNNTKSITQPTIQAAIYCPDNKDEILLAESAQTLAVRCLFGMMGNINVKLCFCQNAFDMSPGGYVPLVRISPCVDSQSKKNVHFQQNAILENFESIAEFCQARYNVLLEKMVEEVGLSQVDNQMFNRGGNSYLDNPGSYPNELKEVTQQVIGKNISFFHPDSHQYSEMNLHLNLCNDLSLIELYINWIHEPTFLKITSKRFTFKKPWPLDKLLLNEKRTEITNYLSAKGWAKKGLKQVETIFNEILLTFSNILGRKMYLMEDERPCVLDALLFGHLYTLMTTRGIDNRLADAIQKYENLVEYLKNMEGFATVGSRSG